MVDMFASTGELELAVLGLASLLSLSLSHWNPRGNSSLLLLGAHSCSRNDLR
jgi:hypothetical protein